MTGAAEWTTAVSRHVLIVSTAGSFTSAGERVTGPVTSVDKLERLIEWAHGRGLLQPFVAARMDAAMRDEAAAAPARVWVVGAACRQLTGMPNDAHPDQEADLVEQVGRSLGPLVGRGWELKGGLNRRFILARGRGPQRISVEVVVEPQPWLGGAGPVADDVEELGRRLSRWATALGVLPGTSGAASGAVVVDQIMRTRAARRPAGAVVSTPGCLPRGVWPELRTQPAWAGAPRAVEDQLDQADELVWLEQRCPQLASAGMLTLGYGPPQVLPATQAAAAAQAPKRPFALWRATLPAADSLTLPEMLPAPHPQMRAAEPTRVWLTTEDLDGLCQDVRDGGAGLAVGQLTIDEAIVWPQQGRLLEAWATRLRQARAEFADDPALRSLVESAAAHYVAALADPQRWTAEEWRHHFQPAWAAAIAAHDRFRGRRAAMRISREYRLWPVYAREAAMIYAAGADESTGAPIDLSDTHSRLGRMAITRRVALSDETVLAVVLAETPADVAGAVTAALSIAAEHDAAADETSQSDAEPGEITEPAVARPGGDEKAQPAEENAPARRKSSARRVKAPAAGAGAPAAVLHTDGLWLSDGTRVELTDPIVHVGQVAELAYSHHIGYQLTAAFAEPGQIWLTDQLCRLVGIDVEAINRRDRAKSLRQITEGIDFVTLAVAQGWSLGGAGEDPNAQRLGTWTRIYREDRDKRGVMIALIPGMGAGPDEMPILADDPAPARIARRLQLLADALRFPWKINAGVTAVDLMLQTRTKTWSPRDWRDVVFAASTITAPFGIGDVESDFDWSRPPTSDEHERRYVHAYDRGGSYVAGIAGLELPIGNPVHHPDGASFDPKTPGYWLANIPEQADWRLPYVLNPRGLQFNGPKWVCTPRLERAVELGYQPDVLEAWIWPQHGRVLLGWYERFRDASTTLDTDDPDAQAARNQAKVIRTHGIGIIGSDEHLKGKPGYSPERRFHVVSKANSNIVYRLHQIGERSGQWPVAVATDTVLYASDDPDPVTAWPGGPQTLGRGFGQYRPEASGLLADHLDFLNGRDYRGKRELIPADQWRQTLPQMHGGNGSGGK